MTLLPIKRILLATDFSGCAEQASDYAGFLGQACPAAVDILHVVEVPPELHPDNVLAERYFDQCRKEAEKPLDELVRRLASVGVAARWRQQLGIPSRLINRAAEELGADLVTLGACGSSGLSEVLLGSTVQRVVHAAPCPVLTVHLMPPGRGAPSTVRHVLAPVDFSFCSLDALDYAAQLATQFGAMLTVLHVMEPVLLECEGAADSLAVTSHQRERAAARLVDLCHELRGQGIAVETAIDGGNTAEAILTETNRRSCDLIVMGTRGRRGLTSLIGGSVAEGVLRQATVPVLTVKRLQVPPAARLLSAEIQIRVGDETAAGERTR